HCRRHQHGPNQRVALTNNVLTQYETKRHLLLRPIVFILWCTRKLLFVFDAADSDGASLSALATLARTCRPHSPPRSAPAHAVTAFPKRCWRKPRCSIFYGSDPAFRLARRDHRRAMLYH